MLDLAYLGVKLIWKLVEKLEHKGFLKLQRPSGVTVIKDMLYYNNDKYGFDTKQIFTVGKFLRAKI